MDIKALDQQYLVPAYKRFDLAIVKGSGAVCEDENGKSYIDLGGGIAVNTFGYADPDWVAAVTKQLSLLQHASNLYYTAPQVLLAKALTERTGMRRVFFSNSGAEANECMIKTMRKYAFDHHPDRKNIITLQHSFHGRTITTLSATGQGVFHQHFDPFTPGFLYLEPDQIAAMHAMVEQENPIGFLIELVQGEGGVHALDPQFVRAIEAICKEKDLLLAIDEVQTGNGRTGAFLCAQRYGVAPDLVSLAKGLAGGLPIGATLFSEKTMDTLGNGTHGSTFGGNPVAAAGALHVLSRLDDALMQEVLTKGERIFSRVSGAKGVRAVEGMGLMIGIETERNAADIVSACLARGVLVLTASGRVRLLPPLNIETDLLEQAIDILLEEIAQ